MDDLIYRQDAIDAAEKESQVDGAYGYMDTKSIVDLLNDLPSAERKKGKWIYSDDDEPLYDSYFCSCCHRYITVDAERKCDIGFIIDDFDFCPHCGAEMREHDDI